MISESKIVEVLEELKQTDYECLCHRGFSRLSEEQRDFVISAVKRRS